jgi:PAB-dependent poly(A)-specific ribonuclease subunit 3
MVVHTYHPLAKTLAEVYLARSSTAYGNTISESLLISLIVQLSGAISRIHAASLAARVIDPTKVILTGKDRYFQISC